MSGQGQTYQDAGMRELVAAEKETVLNSGTVKSADDQALSTLAERSTAAREASPLAAAKAGRVPRGASRGRARSRGAAEGAAVSDQTAAQPGRLGGHRAPIGAKAAIGNAAVDELDDTEEFSGAAGVRDKAVLAKRLSAKARGAGKANGPVRQAGSGKRPGASSKKASRAAGSAKGKGAAKGASASAVRAQAAVQAKTAEAAGGAKAAAAAKSTSAKAIGGAIASAAAPLGGVFAGVLAFILVALAASQLVAALFGFWQNEAAKQSLAGLPPYITYEMVEEAIECQEDYGHPAGCTIAQIICESGQGDHMSRLAERDHNLFGMKWSSSFAACPEVTGKSAWATNEEYGGEAVAITAYFTSFTSDVDCIRFRSRVFLQAGHYANNPLIREAIEKRDSDKMAEGLKDAGWATSSSYVESLKSAMDAYGLRRFDGMSLEEFRSLDQARSTVVAAARSQLGVPYVWGGTTPGVGLDCSGLTQYCYAQAGISIPRNSEDQAAFGTKVPVSLAEPGDILWRPGHVAIFIGDDKYIHEPYSGEVCREASGVGYFTAAIKVIG